MIDKLTATKKESIQAQNAAARMELLRLIQGGDWRMGIPAQEADSDRVLNRLCNSIDYLLARVDVLEYMIFKYVRKADVTQTDTGMELYREIVAKFEKKAEEES